MVKNELLVFIQYDSDFKAPARYGFHTAIKDPNAKTGHPARESIECRLVAFFPKHTPNTIPKAMRKEEQELKDPELIIKKCSEAVMQAIKYPSFWPDQARKDFAKSIRKKSLKDVIKGMVEYNRNSGLHGMKNASDKLVQKVVQNVMKNKQEFLDIALKNFPLIK